MGNMLLVLLAGQVNMAGRDVAVAEDLTGIPGLFLFLRDFKWHPAEVGQIPRRRPRPQGGFARSHFEFSP